MHTCRYRDAVEIFLLVVPNQTVSGLTFDMEDLDQFKDEISIAYGTSTDRLLVQSVVETSLQGTELDQSFSTFLIDLQSVHYI